MATTTQTAINTGKAAKKAAYTNRAEVTKFALDCMESYEKNGQIPVIPKGWARLQTNGRRSDWAAAYDHLAQFWNGTLSDTVKTVFVLDGNAKLPFVAFSTLPLLTCPGKGACAVWCYSLKAWRNPHAFMRQLINTLRLLTVAGRNQIVKAWHSLPQGAIVRLYVDGDIDSKRTMAFWFQLLIARSDIRCYGYSKSWEIFLDWNDSGRPFPDNYILNLSGGSKYGSDTLAKMAELPIVRGEFLAVDTELSMPKGRTSADIKNAPTWGEYSRQARAAAANMGMGKVWVCPGRCGDCMGNGEHACGNPNITIPVIIAVH